MINWCYSFLILIFLQLINFQPSFGNDIVKEIVHNFTKSDCVKHCHDEKIVTEASEKCKRKEELLCKAKHFCAELEVCKCRNRYICEMEEETKFNDYSIIDDESESKVKEEVQRIARGGQRNFMISTKSDRKGCQTLCSSVSVTKGCFYGHSCKVSQECHNGKCQCFMKLECKSSSSDLHNLEDFEAHKLQEALLSIKHGGSKSLTFKSTNENSCLSKCQSDVIKDGCYDGYKCNTSATKCDHQGCKCNIIVECNDGHQILDSDERLTSFNLHIIKPLLNDIELGGRRRIHFSRAKQEVCSTLCSSTVVQETCSFGRKSCEAQNTICDRSRWPTCKCFLDLQCNHGNGEVIDVTDVSVTSTTEKEPFSNLWTEEKILEEARILTKDQDEENLNIEMSFKVEDKQKCQNGCGLVRKGGCGSKFIGSFRCSFKNRCTNTFCQCELRARCSKASHQAQEFIEHNLKPAFKSLDLKEKPKEDAKDSEDYSLVQIEEKRHHFNKTKIIHNEKQQEEKNKQRKVKTSDHFEFF